MPYCAVDLPNHLRDLVGTEAVVSAYEVIRRFNEQEAEQEAPEEPAKAPQKKKKTTDAQVEEPSIEEGIAAKD